MSCVPSMSAYVATHARQQDDKVTTTQLPQPNDHNSKGNFIGRMTLKAIVFKLQWKL